MTESRSELSSGSAERGLPKTVIVLGWVSFFADVSSEMLYPLLPLFGAATAFVALLLVPVPARKGRNGEGASHR